MPAILVGASAVFVAGFTQGFVGFGFSQVAIPIMASFIPTKEAIPIAVFESVILNLLIIRDTRRYINFRRMWALMLAGITGIPFGTYLLLILDVDLLKFFIGIIIVLSSIAILTGFRVNIKNEKLASIPIGFFSGILNGSTTMSGPPVILFFSNQELDKQTFRANLVTYFFILGLMTIPPYFIGKIINFSVLKYSVIFVPFVISGTLTGMKLSKKVDDKIFRNIALIILIIIGVITTVSGAIPYFSNT